VTSGKARLAVANRFAWGRAQLSAAKELRDSWGRYLRLIFTCALPSGYVLGGPVPPVAKAKGLLAVAGVAVAVGRDSCLPKTSQGFPPTLCSRWCRTHLYPACCLTVGKPKQTGRMLREARGERKRRLRDLSSDLTKH